jgi:hypothetical protein
MIHSNKIKSKLQDKSPPSNAMVHAIYDSNHQKTKVHNPPGLKHLNRKEKKRHFSRRSELQPIKLMTKSNHQQTIQNMLPDSQELFGYIFKQAFNANITKESKETMSFSEYFKTKLDRARSIENIDMKMEPGNYMI